MKSQVIIPGAVKSGRKASGFNLNKFVKKLLESMGFAVTTDCCTYFPTVPLVAIADVNSPTEEELDAAGVPPYGMFRTYNEGIIYIWMREDIGDGAFTLGNNN